MPKQELSPASRRALDTFDEAARVWGYVQDQGVGSEVDTCQEDYRVARMRLVRRLLKLEREQIPPNSHVTHLGPDADQERTR